MAKSEDEYSTSSRNEDEHSTKSKNEDEHSTTKKEMSSPIVPEGKSVAIGDSKETTDILKTPTPKPDLVLDDKSPIASSQETRKRKHDDRNATTPNILKRSTPEREETPKTNIRSPVMPPPPEYVNLHLPHALKHLRDLDSDPLLHRPFVKNEIVRAFEIHESMKVIESLIKSPKIATPEFNSKCMIPADRLKALVSQMKKEYDAIMSLSSKKLTAWENNLRELVRYRVKHGNCSVNTTTPLGKFVGRQRSRSKTTYSRVRDREILAFDKELLNRLNFVWVALDDTKPWEYYFEQLKCYKETHGGCTKVPQLYPENQRLANWVHNQRKRYETLKSGLPAKKGQIYPHQIQKLNEIGFVWKIRFGRPKKNDPRYRNKRYHPVPDAPNQIQNDGNIPNGIPEMEVVDTKPFKVPETNLGVLQEL